MKTLHSWQYVAMAALLSIGGCSTSRQTAQNNGEIDDLYGNSANAVVYNDVEPSVRNTDMQQQRPTRRNRFSLDRNQNPDFADQQGLSNDPNQEEYYTELSARNVQRGISADPGWGNPNGTFNDGFVQGYQAGLGNPAFAGLRPNPWGFGAMASPFFNSINIGFGFGGGWGGGWGRPWGFTPWGFSRFGAFDPFWGSSLAWGGGWGGGWGFDPFWGPGFNSFGSPWGWGNGFGGWGGGFGGWGGGWNRPIYVVNNNLINGVDPNRNGSRTFGPRYASGNNTYNGNFNNAPRNVNSGGGRQSSGYNRGFDNTPTYSNNRGGTNATSNGGYYSGSRANNRGTYYYDNGSTAGGRTSSPSYSAPSSGYSNSTTPSSGGDSYYSRPRANSQGTYSGGSRGSGGYSAPSYQQSQRSSDQPSYSAPQRSYSQPSYSAPQRSYSQPSYSAPQRSYSQPSYSAPSSSGGSRGGGGSSSSGGGGSYSGGGGGGRGPR